MSNLARLRDSLPEGREQAIPGHVLAEQLGFTYRQVQELAASLIAEGVPVGSICTGPSPGFFIMRAGDAGDFEAGTRHIRSRAVSMFRRIRNLERIRVRSHPNVPSLFPQDVAS